MAPSNAPSHLDRVFAAKTPQETRSIYNEWANTYDSEMATHDFKGHKLVAEGLVRGLKRGDDKNALQDLKIVDAGCGTGTVGEELAKFGATDITGLDFSEGMLDIAQKRAVYSDFKIADLTKKLDFEDGVFDALTCCGTFTRGHLGTEPLEECMRIVKPGGLFVATVLEYHWDEQGFEKEVDRLVKEKKVEVVENDIHQYRKMSGGGRVLIMRRM